MNIDDQRSYYSDVKTIREAVIQNAKTEAEKVVNAPELLKAQDPEKYIKTNAYQIAKKAFSQYEMILKEKFSDPGFDLYVRGSVSSQKIDFYMDLPSELMKMMRKKLEELKTPPKSDSQISSKEKIPSSSEFEESPKIKSDSKDPPKKGDVPPSGWIKI